MALRDRSGDLQQQQQQQRQQNNSEWPAAHAVQAGSRRVEPVNLQTQSSEQLADLMMWWKHSRPVKRAHHSGLA
jgi:hypothetical protein